MGVAIAPQASSLLPFPFRLIYTDLQRSSRPVSLAAHACSPEKLHQ